MAITAVKSLKDSSIFSRPSFDTFCDCLATIAAPTVVLITVCYYCDYHFWGDIVGMLECVFKCR